MKLSRLLLICSAVASCSALAGCGSSGGSSVCLSSETAEICVESSDGGAVVVAEGLEPGSQLRVEFEGLPARDYPVAEDGTLGGTVGFLTVVAPDSVRVTVVGTDADGEAIAGEMAVSE